MNITSGITSPETNWARNPARNSSSLVSVKRRSTSAVRPNAVTSSWPVKASSI